MPKHAEVRYADYEPARIFDLVADVESYPSFLPWCTDCRIYRREGNVIHANLKVGFRMFSESFGSRITLDPIDRIDIAYLDGPFRYLHSCWKFSPKGDGCLVDFSIDFEFRSLLLRKVIGAIFNETVRRSVDAFVARADFLYGRGGDGTIPAPVQK